jgi:hypothetical protein
MRAKKKRAAVPGRRRIGERGSSRGKIDADIEKRLMATWSGNDEESSREI